MTRVRNATPPSSPGAPRRARSVRLASLTILLLAAAARVWSAWSDQSIYWPDEIYQSIEQAHRLVYGYGLVPWEFQQGARSWLFPGALAALLELGRALGVQTATGIVHLCRVTMALAAVGALALSMRLARRLADDRAALVAGALGAALPIKLALESRVMSEVASEPLLAGAALLTLRTSRRAAAIAGALVSAACFLRYQNGLAAVGLLALYLAARRWREAGAYAIAGVAVALAGGALDWATWGTPFHSFTAYVRYNLVEGQSAIYGVSGPAFYLRALWSSSGPAILVVGVLFAWAVIGPALAWRRSRFAERQGAGLGLVVVLFVAGPSAVAHKELRFVLPILPVALAVAGAGAAALLQRVAEARRTAVAGLLATALGLALLVSASQLTFGRLGMHEGESDAERAPWHAREGVQRALWAAGEQPAICGLLVVGIRPAWTGGYSYLHADVPIYGELFPEVFAAANFIIGPEAGRPPAPFERLAAFDGWALSGRPGPCAPAAGRELAPHR